METSDYIALGTALVAISALFWQIRASNKQALMQTFLTYTQRYHDIIIHLPIGIESNDYKLPDDPIKREEILRSFRSYFDLCSEEYYLFQNKLISKKAWNLWEAGIRESLKKTAFITAWNQIQTNGYYQIEFTTFINKLFEE